MKRLPVFLISLLLVATSCQQTRPPKAEPIAYESSVHALLTYFQEKAYQDSLGTFFSEIGNDGMVQSGKVFNVALSRLVYGLSFGGSLDASYWDQAAAAADFQQNHLVGEDSIGTFFHSFFDLKTNTADSSLEFDIWQQAYGLCGLSELYRNRPDAELLASIHRYHEGFTTRFHDELHGGFYGNTRPDGHVSGSKTLQALIYPITAYMDNLWTADSANREKYEPFLIENIRLAYEHGWNDDLGWVNIRFADDWQPCPHESADSPCFLVTPGHNFQYASLFLRARNWEFLPLEDQERYFDFGMNVLRETMQKPIFPSQDLSQGFFSEVNPVTSEVTDRRKTWWQHCEALIALSLSDGSFEKEQKNLETFYFDTFPDQELGGEFFYVDENNQPLTEELKGSIGKSAYHTIEMIRFLNQ